MDLRNRTNLTITDRTFAGIEGRAVYLYGCKNVIIDRCHFEDVGQAIIAVECENVWVLRSTYRHLRGPMGMFVQFDKCINVKAALCSGFCDPAVDDVRDIISVYKTDHARVLYNRLDGGGSSPSGSGILVGDQGGSTQLVAGNTLINPGQVGIGIAGGASVTVARNDIYNGGIEGSNVGLYVNNYGGPAQADIEVRDNRVDWRREDGSTNPAWDGGTAGEIAGWDSNTWYDTLDPARLRA